MKLPIGSYISISFEIKYLEHGEEHILATTKEKVSEEEGKERVVDRPRIIRLGDGEIPEFFEKLLQELEVEIGREHNIEVPPEKAYGKRDTKMIEAIPLKRFRRLLQQERLVTEDGTKRLAPGKIVYANLGEIRIYYGRILHIGDRDVIIDRNHPLAGKTMHVWFKIHKVVEPTASNDEKVSMILEKFFGETSSFLRTRFLSKNTLEIELSKDYFMRFPKIDRSIAETILREVYVPKTLLLAKASLLFKDLGVTKIVWIDEYEAKIEVSPKEEAKEEEHAESIESTRGQGADGSQNKKD